VRKAWALAPFTRHWEDPVYRVSWIVVCTPRPSFVSAVRRALRRVDRADAAAILRALTDSGSTAADLDGCAGTCYQLDPIIAGNPVPIVVIWINPGADISVLVHEAWHGVYWVFRSRHVGLDDGGDPKSGGADEPLAYYLQHVVRAALGLARRGGL
jgi:hypothetical protein